MGTSRRAKGGGVEMRGAAGTGTGLCNDAKKCTTCCLFSGTARCVGTNLIEPRRPIGNFTSATT